MIRYSALLRFTYLITLCTIYKDSGRCNVLTAIYMCNLICTSTKLMEEDFKTNEHN